MATIHECIECGSPATERHHVIPKSMGGNATVWLCGGCHAKVHSMNAQRRDSHKALTSAALQARIIKLKEALAKSIGVDSINDPSVELAYREQCKAEATRTGLITKVLPIARAKSIASKQAAAASCSEWRMAGAFVQQALQANPSLSLRLIAEMLNTQGYTTRHGCKFAAQTVKRLIQTDNRQ
jgi:hypothetical protein